jgi:retron-type reverse transcriptase
MAGFWDRIKQFFGDEGGSGTSAVADPLEDKLRQVMMTLAQTKTSFEAGEVARRANVGTEDWARALLAVDKIFMGGTLDPFGYKRLLRDGAYLYNPYSGDGSGTAPPPLQPSPNKPAAPASAPARPASTTTSTSPAPAPKSVTVNSYAANPEILGLSAEEMRKRALKIVPWRTAWIGRVDTIPPQSDERTALIDRGLVLAGYLNEQQLAEIHTIGDQWIKHHDASKLASALAQKSADAAIEAEKAAKAKVREEKKKASAERKAHRAAAIAKRRAEDIVFLGRGVSRGLADRRSNIEELQKRGLPVLSTPGDVAKALGLPVPKLRWLCFHSEAAQRVHYVAFEIPKRSGGVRRIAAPMETLAIAQQWVLHNVLEKLPVEEPAHGFVKGRSTVTNAKVHLKRGVVVNIDLKDFFPSITFPRVRGVFQRLGYSPAVATILTLLCTEAPRQVVEHDGVKYFVAVGPRALPQGACTSPALSNQIARRIDKRLTGRTRKLGWTYTRYADDLTFSTMEGRTVVARLQAIVRHVAQEEGFKVNEKKGRVLVKAGRQQVTGVVVNEKPGVPRETVRRLRAILHQAKKTGLEAQNREKHPNFRAWLGGMIAYVSMIDAAKGAKLKSQLDALKS